LNATGENADDDSDTTTDSNVGGTTDEREVTETTGDDGLEQNLDDASNHISSNQLHEQDSSDSETPRASNKVASKGDDGEDESDKDADKEHDLIDEKEIPPEKETIRDQLEKAGIRTNGNEPLLTGC